jgi:putative membrane protein
MPRDQNTALQEQPTPEVTPPQPATAAPAKPPNPNELRDHLANERTLLAWARTAITIMALGFVIAKFGILVREVKGLTHAAQEAVHFSALFGAALACTGAVALAFAAAGFVRVKRGIDRQEVYVSPTVGLVVAAVLTIVGLLLAVYLLVTG